jgi:CDP-6-deoxy-D-xylo-4-hexulose-3-dehydrase
MIIENLFKKYCDIRTPITHVKSDVSWFCLPLISSQKQQLVTHLESNGIQTRNFFANNILQQPAFCHLGNFAHYPEAQKFADTVFFVGCAPHYTQETFDYFEEILSKFDKHI